MSAARTLGGSLPVAMMASSRENASSWRRRCGVSSRTSRNAGCELLGRCISLHEFRDHILADHEICENDRRGLGERQRNPHLDRARRDRRRSSARRRARVRGSRCRIWRRPHAQSGTPLSFPARRARCAAAPANSRRPSRTASSRCGMVGSTSSKSAPCSRSRRSVSPNTAIWWLISLRRLPGSTSRTGGLPSRRRCSEASGRSEPICSIRVWPI